MSEKIEKTDPESKTVKCVVWDLDNTMWDGILLEDENVRLRQKAVSVIKELDARGILHSIASRNEYETALKKLKHFGIDEYFLYPQISWRSKALSIAAIAETINIGLDTIAFIDDDPFEREEVKFSLPQVRCIDAAEIDRVLDMPEMMPRFVTDDSKIRRHLYLADQQRNRVEKEYEGPKENFLASLGMELTFFTPLEEDMKRAEELTVRTHQLNATGYTYSYDELNAFRQSDGYRLIMAKLQDRFGTYGNIGLALVETLPEVWTIKLLLMSCRVMSRGVGTIMMSHIQKRAQDEKVRLLAEFVPTDRNRMMNITYRLAGFQESGQVGDVEILENDLTNIQPFPKYVKVIIDE